MTDGNAALNDAMNQLLDGASQLKAGAAQLAAGSLALLEGASQLDSGLGQLTQQAVNNQDIAVLQAVVMISALGFVLINLLVDLVMPRLDPRLHLQTGGAK